jgi:hypothetical protein
MEIQYLIAGQPNAVDAMRFKEYVVEKKLNVKSKTMMTTKERLRIQELMG